MKASDLMIGDWYYWEAEGKMYPYQVTAKDFVKGEIPNFQPIPLTSEILEKNGYMHDKLAELALIVEGATQDTCVLISNDYRIMINNASHNINSTNKWFVHVDTEDMCSMAGFEITYVHELQHALKLCGIEKEIVL